MSGQFTPVGSQRCLDYLSGTLSTSLVTATGFSTYLMLVTAAPSNMASLSTYPEVSAAGYARQPVSWSAAALNASSVYQISNSTAVLFGPFTGSAGIGAAAVGCALVTALTGVSGTPLMYWTFDTPGSASQNASLQIAIGALVMGLS
jgi:hypothetical protein